MIAEGEIQTAQGILNASAITVPTGSLMNGAYDEVGNFYQMPEHIISDPANLVEDSRTFQENTKGESSADDDTDDDDSVTRRREEKGKGVLKSGDIVRVKARLSDRGGPDIIITMGKQQNVRVLVRRIQEEINVSGGNLSGCCIRNASILDNNPPPSSSFSSLSLGQHANLPSSYRFPAKQRSKSKSPTWAKSSKRTRRSWRKAGGRATS